MMANISSFGLYLLATLLFLSAWVNHSLALTNNAAENIPRGVHPKEPSQIDRLELTIQTMMSVMEDGFARTAREVGDIKGGVASLEEEITALKEGMKSSLEERLKSLEVGMKSLEEGLKSSLEEKLSHEVGTITSSLTDIKNHVIPPSNCYDVQKRGHSSSGLYSVTISEKMVKVYCDMATDGGGWTVIQRRDEIEPHVDFHRGWSDYKRGFGDLEGEFWLGLDAIHGLTTSTPMVLRVELEDWEGEERVASYSTFGVGGEGDKYQLTVGGYQWKDGGQRGSDVVDGLKWHNGDAFTTRDRDNDRDGGQNCAKRHKGGWWYRYCADSNLNGVYLKGKTDHSSLGVTWVYWKGSYYSLRRAAMKIRPR